MKQSDLISIIIPAFNETRGVVKLIDKTELLPLKKEIIIVDDGSTNPQALQAIKTIKKKYPSIKLIINQKNEGKSASIQKGLQFVSGDKAVILDGDSELDPKDILILAKAMEQKKARLVNGVRIIRHKIKLSSYSNRLTRAVKKFLSFFIYLFYGEKIKDVLSGYKLFYTEDFKNHAFRSRKFGLETELLTESLKRGQKVVEVDVNYHPRTYKEGKKINVLDGFEILNCAFLNITVIRLWRRSPLPIIALSIFVWIISFSFYTLHGNTSPTSDSLPNNFTAVNIIYNKRLDITNFKQYLIKRKIVQYVAIINNQDQWYAKTPIINGLLSAPFFFVFDRINNIQHVSAEDFLKKDYEGYYQIAGKYYASLLVSISVVFIFLAIYKLFGSKIIALLGSIAYAFATLAYSTAAQGNWQHGPSLLLISASFYLLLHFLQKRQKGSLFLISVLLAVATLIRIINIIFFPILLTVLFFNKNYRKYTLLPLLLFFGIIVGWNVFFSLLGVPGGYNSEIIRSFTSFNQLYSAKVLVSLLFSPNVGLLVFSPIFILSFLGFLKLFFDFFREKNSFSSQQHIFLLISFLSFMALFLSNSMWWAWEGGYSYGPRMLTEGTPFLIYLGSYFAYSLKENVLTSTMFLMIFLLLFIYSFLIQIIGVYAHDTDWHYKYYEGRSRLDMAWYNSPNIIDYYLKVKRVFFIQRLIKDKKGLRIEKTYYLLDANLSQLTPIRINITFL